MSADLRIRYADNVLDSRDFGVMVLTIKDGVTVSAKKERGGVYSLDDRGSPSVGWDLKQLSRWSGYDATGMHPEIYHEIFIGGVWKDGVSAEAMERELGRKEG